jgi:glycine/D-amino acid oxidase-like deaminating enzyme
LAARAQTNGDADVVVIGGGVVGATAALECARVGAGVVWTFPRLKLGIDGAETCLYTNTPDERFALERRGRIAFAAACNGQGFQLAPESGRRVADLALEQAEVGAR